MKRISVHIRKINLNLMDLIEKLYDLGLLLYLFAHTAVGWNPNYVLFRRVTTAVCIVMGLILCFSYMIKQHNKMEIDLFMVSYVLFAFWGFTSCLWSVDMRVTWSTGINLIRGIFFVIPMSVRIKDKEDIKQMIYLYVLYVISCLGFIYLTFDFSSGVVRLGASEESGNIVNILAHIGGMGVVLNLFIIQDCAMYKTKKILALLAETIIIILTTLCGSRSGIFAIAMGFLAYTFSYSPNAKKIKWLIVALCGVGVFVYLINHNRYMNILLERSLQSFFNFIFKRDGVAGMSLGIRSRMISQGIDLWSERPWFGWGLNSFSILSPYQAYAHNNYVELLSGVGLIGFLLYYTICGVMGIALLAVPKGQNMYRSLGFALFIVFIFLNFVGVTYTSPRNYLVICLIFKICKFEGILKRKI